MDMTLRQIMELAVKYIESQQFSDAQILIKSVEDAGHMNPSLYYLYGHCFMNQGKFLQAYQAFQNAINSQIQKGKPVESHWEYCMSVAKMKAQIGEINIDILKNHALDKPDDVYKVAAYCLGLVRISQEMARAQETKLQDALDMLNPLLEQNLSPDEIASVYNVKGLIYHQLGDYATAEYNYRQAVLAQPSKADAHHNLGHILSIRGNYLAAWRELEYRWQTEQFRPQIRDLPGNKLAKFSHHQLADSIGKSLLVHAEQGLGDELFYLNSVPKLAIYQFSKITITCDARLISLFSESLPQYQFIDRETQKFPHHDFHAHLASVPYLVDLFADQKPLSPILKSQSLRTNQYRKQLQKMAMGRKLVAFSWRTQANSYERRNFNLLELSDLLNDDNLAIINVQYGDVSADLNQYTRQESGYIYTINEIDNQRDISALASLIDACDYLVSADISTAHLGASLGVRTIVLLPDRPNMRWSEFQKGTSLWYPSMTLIPMRTKAIKPDDKIGWRYSALKAKDVILGTDLS